MGRPSKGWRLKPQPGTSILAVVWTQPPAEGESRGRECQRSTGERDPRRAAKVAATIYSAAIRGAEPEHRRAARWSPSSLEALSEQWLAARTDLDEQTKATYALYFETHLCPSFATLASVHAESVREYSTRRLTLVSASTVRHELSALRMLIRWACPNENADLLVPTLPKGTRGTSFEKSAGKRRRGKPTELTEQETLAIIAKLPEWSRKSRDPSGTRFPIRARFVVKYETGLREALLDQLSVPEHWDPAKPEELRITPELDKMRYARTVPLTPAAQEALTTVSGLGGLLFGAHDYRSSIRAAALRAGLPEHRVKTLAPNDLRHARATHIGAKPEATLNAMMFMFGWTQPSTAARYMHPTAEAVKTMLGSVATVGGETSSTSKVARPAATSRGQPAAPLAEQRNSARPGPDDEPPFGFG